MFKVGDKVVYPMHGAGVIEAIEDKVVLGARRSYYVMHLSVGGMRVMIPTTGSSHVGLREVILSQEVPRVIEILRGQRSKMPPNWNHRYRANLEKMKTGSIFDVAEVVRDLASREREKGLSTGERKMLENARQILISELVLVQDISPSKATTLVNDLLA